MSNLTWVSYKPINDVESPNGYRPGGYHPVRICDQLHDRYTIIDKLGFGSYATVWLAIDHVTDSYVETLRKLHELGSQDQTARGKLLIPPVLDDFTVAGPNGLHPCLVTVPAGISVRDAKDDCLHLYERVFQPSVGRAIIAQLVHAIVFLHSNGVVHGDLHYGNILFQLPESFRNLTLEQYYEKYGCPWEERMERVERRNGQPLPEGVPFYAVIPAPTTVALGQEISFSEAQILLTDFGESYMPQVESRYASGTPKYLHPPELYFSTAEPLSFPADIWALAVAIWGTVGAYELFSTRRVTTDEWIQERVVILGPMPSDWWQKWRTRMIWFDERGAMRGESKFKGWAELFDFCIQRPREELGIPLEEDEKTALEELLRSMLAWKPEEGPTALQVLESEWMRKWALPDLERMDAQLRHSTTEGKGVGEEKPKKINWETFCFEMIEAQIQSFVEVED
ncbi:kinase-like protein [Westerdykella ornata]|uniref:non-specific serine/threonine protein kinase n=1 Tax=Westerdykella ornata TaxID=318751 RepID=A0A6A6JKL5_WESOR|nr:kinase-like protein [Westerdykella ornata]KAF2277022.1 kinase-like protein [Westerdykella ornata]